MPQVLRRKGRCFMKRLKNLVLMLVLVLTSGLTTAALAAEQPQECISLSGTAEAEVAPDMATLYINLETKAPTAVEARDGVAAKLHDIQNVLLGAIPQVRAPEPLLGADGHPAALVLNPSGWIILVPGTLSGPLTVRVANKINGSVRSFTSMDAITPLP